MSRARIAPALLSLFAVAAVCAGPAAAQDAQYWTQQYGNEARLLGGAVVGGTADMAATYYNPGRLALVDEPKLLLAGNVFEYTSLSVAGRRDEGRFESSRLGSVPSLLAGMIGRPRGGDSRWAYSVLGRQFSNIWIDERRDASAAMGFPVDLATAAYSLDQSVSEYWGGLTWSKPLSGTIGIGISGYVTVRSQHSRSVTLAQAARGTAAGLAVQRRDFEYNHWGALAKVGIGADLGAWQCGLTATTPNLKLMGSGNTGVDESVVTQDLDGDGTAVAEIISDYQPDLAADYRWAPSVALGASRRSGRTTLHGSVEWFAGVPGYVVMDLDPIASSDGATVRDVDLRDERAAVFNYALGVEHAFRETLQGYASFRTDFSAAAKAQSPQIAVSVWDIYHLAAGATFRALESDFTLGVIYAFGNATDVTAADLVPESADGGNLSDGGEIDIAFRRLTGLIGFAFGF